MKRTDATARRPGTVNTGGHRLLDTRRRAGSHSQRAVRAAALPSARTTTQRGKTQQERMLRTLGQFRVIVRAIRAHYHAIEKVGGISGAQLWAMSKIDETLGVRVSETHSLAVHVSTVSNLLDPLTRGKLVKRARGPDDQRVVRLYLTPKGKRVLSSAPGPSHGLLQEVLLSLPRDRLTALSALLQELIEDMGLDQRRGSRTPLSELVR